MAPLNKGNIQNTCRWYLQNRELQCFRVFLNSPAAIKVNIEIIRVFTKIRKILTESLNVKLEIEEIKKKLVNHDKNIELVFNYLDEMIEKQENKVERNKIGYKK